MRDRAIGLAGVVLEGLEGRQLMSVGTITDQGAVRMETSLGRITVLLTPDATPLTVANFLRYVDGGLYGNTIVHRSVPGFVIQAGGYQASGTFTHITQFDPIPNEFDAAQAAAGGGPVNVRGTIAMAKLGSDPNSATSEWFVNLADNSSNLDNQNGGFTTFGRVVGGGMHVADAIAGLPVRDGTKLNDAFTDLPVVETAQGPQAVVVASAVAERVLPVTLDASTKTVTWVDEHGAKATITLTGGTADLMFVGRSDMTYKVTGNQVTVSGTGVQLTSVSTHGTNAGSVLSITSRGGKGPAHVGDITTDGTLKQIDAKTVWLDGDLNAAGAVGRVDFLETNRSTLNIGGTGSTTVNMKTAVDTSVNTTMTLKGMTVNKWVDDGLLPTSVVAAGIGQMKVTGNFSSNVSSTGSVGTVVVNGNVGTLGASTWNVAGGVGSVKVRAVKDWTLRAAAISNLTASGGIESSTIATTGSIGTVTAQSLKGTMVAAGGWNGSNAFANSGGAVGKVTLRAGRAAFSNSMIAGVAVGMVHLGAVTTGNSGQAFGVTAGQGGVLRLDAVVGGKAVSLRGVKDEGTVISYFAAKKIVPGDFEVAFV